MTIFEQLAPLIQDYGICKAARDAGISKSVLCEWLKHKNGRRLGDEQVDRISTLLGKRIELLPLDKESNPLPN